MFFSLENASSCFPNFSLVFRCVYKISESHQEFFHGIFTPSAKNENLVLSLCHRTTALLFSLFRIILLFRHWLHTIAGFLLRTFQTKAGSELIITSVICQLSLVHEVKRKGGTWVNFTCICAEYKSTAPLINNQQCHFHERKTGDWRFSLQCSSLIKQTNIRTTKSSDDVLPILSRRGIKEMYSN